MSRFRWAVANRPIGGEAVSGDLHVAVEFPGGALFGVIDGLGHGPEAATAARAAAAALCEQPDRPVLTLISACHEALRSTRGAVVSLASIGTASGDLTWAGVGNVEAVLHRASRSAEPGRERIILRSGVVGYQLPPLRSDQLRMFPGDVLVFASDGVRQGFGEEPPIAGDAQATAEHLLRTFARGNDDACVLVAIYEGAAA